MRCRIRTLMIVLAIGPPLLALLWWAIHIDENTPSFIFTVLISAVVFWLGSLARQERA